MEITSPSGCGFDLSIRFNPFRLQLAAQKDLLGRLNVKDCVALVQIRQIYLVERNLG
jgi:hypothetical protein